MGVGGRYGKHHKLLTDLPEMVRECLIVRAFGRPFLLLLYKVLAAHAFQFGRGRQVEFILRTLLDCDHEGAQKLHQPGHLLSIVSHLGFDMTTNVSLLSMFNAYIVGFVLGEMGEAEAQRRTGLSQQEWQEHVASYVQEQIIASGRYPHLARSIVEGEERPTDEIFIFGLTRLLEGIAAY